MPMIVSWPGVTAPESTCQQPVIIEDFFPTILEVANVKSFEQIGGEIDGISFAKSLRGETDSRRDDRPLIWHFPNNWGPTGPGIGASSSIRVGDWKLIYYHASREYELFHLASDLSETTNRFNEEPEVSQRLAKQLTTYLRSVDAQMPTDKSTGKQVPYPELPSKR